MIWTPALIGAGAVMLLGWLAVWTLSYPLNSDYTPEFTQAFLRRAEPLDALVDFAALATRLEPGLAPGDRLATKVNSLALVFVVVDLAYVLGLVALAQGRLPTRVAASVVLVLALLYESGKKRGRGGERK